jgi:hypothetical protein
MKILQMLDLFYFAIYLFFVLIYLGFVVAAAI